MVLPPEAGIPLNSTYKYLIIQVRRWEASWWCGAVHAGRRPGFDSHQRCVAELDSYPSHSPPLPLPPSPHHQMHYTNPERATDIIDSSGLSLGITTKLRPHEAGTMMLGPLFDQFQIRVPAKRVRAEQGGAWCGVRWCGGQPVAAAALHQEERVRGIAIMVVPWEASSYT